MCSGGDLNPILGFCFPLVSMCFPWEFPSGWKTVESSGSKSLVFFGQSMYIFSVRCNILQAGDAGAVNGESLVVTAKGLESNEILLVFDLV